MATVVGFEGGERKFVGNCATSFFTLALLSTALIGTSQTLAQQDLFAKGEKRVTVILGSGTSFDEDYFILGVGAGYYVLDGLELGLNWQSWLGGDPSINQITPEATYVFRNSSRFDPYVGALYRETFIDGLDDLSAWGARGGVNVSTGANAYVGIGVVYLSYQDCEERVYSDCSETYPEIVFSFNF